MIPKIFRLFIVFLLVFAYCTKIQTEMPITTSSKQALTYYLQAQKLLDNLKWQKAIPLYKQAIEKDPNFAFAHLDLGFCYFRQGDIDAGYEHYNMAMKLRDNVTEGEKLYLDNVKAGFEGNLKLESELTTRLVTMFPQDKRLHFGKGTMYFRTQDWENAISEYQKTIIIDPRFAPVYNQLAYAYLYSGKYDKAEQTIKTYTDLIPDESNPWDSYGEILLKQGKFNESIKAYEKALELDPAFYLSYDGIATNYMLMDQPDKAMQTLNEFYNKADATGMKRIAQSGMIRCCIDNHDFDKAMEIVQTRLDKAKSDNDELNIAADINLQGDLLFEKEMYDEALQKYKQAMNLVDQSKLISTEEKENIGQSYLFDEIRIDIKTNRIEDAKSKISKYADFARANNNKGQLKAHHQLLGLLAMQENRWEDAVKELEQSNLRNPRNLCCLANAYRAMGDSEKAKQYCDLAVNFNENSINYAYVRKQASELMAAL